MKSCSPYNKKIILLLVYMLLVVFLSAIPMDREIRGLQFIIEMKPLIQSLMHVPFYAVLSILWLQVLKMHQITGRKCLIMGFISAVGFGILIEFIQIAVPGRYPSFIDMGLNTVGALVGLLLYLVIEKSGTGIVRRIVCD